MKSIVVKGQRHTVGQNPGFKDKLTGSPLAEAERGKDLRVAADGSVNSSTPCASAVEKANSRLEFIKERVEN